MTPGSGISQDQGDDFQVLRALLVLVKDALLVSVMPFTICERHASPESPDYGAIAGWHAGKRIDPGPMAPVRSTHPDLGSGFAWLLVVARILLRLSCSRYPVSTDLWLIGCRKSGAHWPLTISCETP